MSNIENDLKIYAAREIASGKLVSDITNPREKYWDRRTAAQTAINKFNSGHKVIHSELELVTFKLVEIK